jgi:hypothetical protein
MTEGWGPWVVWEDVGRGGKDGTIHEAVLVIGGREVRSCTDATCG